MSLIRDLFKQTDNKPGTFVYREILKPLLPDGIVEDSVGLGDKLIEAALRGGTHDDPTVVQALSTIINKDAAGYKKLVMLGVHGLLMNTDNPLFTGEERENRGDVLAEQLADLLWDEAVARHLA